MLCWALSDKQCRHIIYLIWSHLVSKLPWKLHLNIKSFSSSLLLQPTFPHYVNLTESGPESSKQDHNVQLLSTSDWPGITFHSEYCDADIFYHLRCQRGQIKMIITAELLLASNLNPRVKAMFLTHVDYKVTIYENSNKNTALVFLLNSVSKASIHIFNSLHRLLTFQSLYSTLQSFHALSTGFLGRLAGNQFWMIPPVLSDTSVSNKIS